MAGINHRVAVMRRGSPDGMELIAEELPRPDRGEVRVQVEAAGISGYDIMLRSRSFLGFPKVPYTPGEDFVGIVDELGADVASLTIGERVAGWTFGDMGGYVEHLCRPAEQLVPVPDDLDSSDAVSLVVNYLTSYLALHLAAQAKSGERMLVHGAAGGIGSAVVQLGSLAGLEIYGTASRHNHELVAELGATPIDYRNQDFATEIRRHSPQGVDIVIDPIGGARQLWRSYRTLRRGGRLLMLGMAAATRTGTRVIPSSLLTVGLLKLLPDGRTLPMQPAMQNYPQQHIDWYRETLGELLDLAATGKLRPTVAARFPLADVVKAHQFIEAGGYAGKVVLVCGSGGLERP